MDLSKALAELRQELERLDEAILSLEKLKEQSQKGGYPLNQAAGAKRAAAGGRAGRKHSEDASARNR